MPENLAYIHRHTPAQDDSRNVTLLLLHGAGGDENSLAALGRMLLPGARQLSPRGNVLENNKPRFFRRFAEGMFDVDDLKKRAGDLANFIQQASILYDFDARQVIAASFSNGANIAASILFLHPTALQAAILLHPMVPFAPDALPDLRDKPVFIGAGRADPLVPAEQTEQLAELLKRAGASVDVFWQNGGHTVSPGEVKAAKRWLSDRLPFRQHIPGARHLNPQVNKSTLDDRHPG